ncbi:MAG: hypothetical protein HYY17_01300 [Planctomycetes bacterium]|nr:hypothetical protein [Planctomycetota bacterium]
MRRSLIGIPLLAVAAWLVAGAARGEGDRRRMPKHRARHAETAVEPAPAAGPASVLSAESVPVGPVEEPAAQRAAGDPEAVGRSIAVATADPDAAVRARALRGLPVGLDPDAAARVAVCLHDPDPSVARAAIAVLRFAKALDPRTLTMLRDAALGTGGDGETRRAARRALLGFAKDLSAADRAALEEIPQDR